jgi:serine/threonine protein kinase
LTPFQPISFGRYFLIDKIAVGGMAEVFKAKSFSHGGFEKLLVIKRILQHLSDNEEFVDMFIDEAKISVELQHPNIVQIYDFGRIQENYFIAMECVEGKDVKDILRKLAEKRKLLPTEYAVYIAHEMCKGLDYAHKRTDMQGSPLGIVHRDVSPSNILVSYSGEVKVADFGIAKAQISAYNTKGGVLKGKFEYMSPEQASGETLTHQADIFATGIILHEMLTGRRLFKTDSDVKTLEKIKAADVERPSKLNPGVPKRLDDIVMRALAVDRSDRFEDARELQNALLEFMYPATPDLTRENLGHFLTELFSAEIRTERDRLESGTKVAAELREHAPEIDLDAEWEESPGSGQTLHIQPSRTPLFAALIALFALGAGVIWVATQQTQPVAVTEPATPKPDLSASLHLQIEPDIDATITIDDKVIGEGVQVIHHVLIVGQEFELKVSADGYQTFTERYTVASQERLRLPITMLPIPPPPTPEPVRTVTTDQPKATITPPATPQQPAAPGKLNVNVRGGWAEVYIDGQRVDTTPLYHHPLSAGPHTIEIVHGSTGERQSRQITIFPNQTSRITF